MAPRSGATHATPQYSLHLYRLILPCLNLPSRLNSLRLWRRSLLFLKSEKDSSLPLPPLGSIRQVRRLKEFEEWMRKRKIFWVSWSEGLTADLSRSFEYCVELKGLYPIEAEDLLVGPLFFLEFPLFMRLENWVGNLSFHSTHLELDFSLISFSWSLSLFQRLRGRSYPGRGALPALFPEADLRLSSPISGKRPIAFCLGTC